MEERLRAGLSIKLIYIFMTAQLPGEVRLDQRKMGEFIEGDRATFADKSKTYFGERILLA